MRLTLCVPAVVVCVLAGLVAPADASPPANFTNELLTSAAVEPIALTWLPDGRMLIVEKGGRILITDPTVTPLVTSTYMTITNINSTDERGLLNIVLDPDFTNNNYFYVYYHRGSPALGRISRFTHQENSGGLTSTGNLASEFVVWTDTDGYTSCCHYGGGLDIGPDGHLYLTIGEKFVGTNAQDLTKAAGKIIRVATNGTFPAGNYGLSDGVGGGIYDGIFAYGLRNPYRAKWDLPTGRMFIGEVGGNNQTKSTEDVHIATLSSSGTNYGWPMCEGACDNPDFPSCNCGLHDDPIFYYPHGGSGASITGGMVYRGSQFPTSPYEGAYFYGDYVRGWIRYLTFNLAGDTVTGDFSFEPTAGIVIFIGEGPDGAVYYTTYDGEVRRFTYDDGNQAPTIDTADATPSLGTPPLQVTFNATATDPESDPMMFAWFYGDGDSTAGSVVAGTVPTQMHTYTTNGVYNPTLYVWDATNTPTSTSLLVRVGNPPSVTITMPADMSTFVAGDTIFYAGSATDLDETLDGSNFAWTLRFKHNEHFHPGPFSAAPGTTGYFVIENSGHDWNDDTGYVLDVIVTDSDGLTGVDTVSVLPDKVNLTFDTVPSGVLVTFDGVPFVTPFIYDTLKGFQHTISVPAAQCLAGSLYTFTGWSDGGAATHVITAPTVDSSYVASYVTSGECGVPVESGLVLSLRGDEGITTSGSTVTNWADQSGSGNDFTNLLGTPTLVNAGLNGHDVIMFDGVDDGMGRNGFTGLPTGAADRTMFIVVRYQSDGWGGFAYGTALCNQAFGLSVANTANNGNLMVQGWCGANDFVTSEPGNGAGWMTQSVVLESNAFTHFKDGAIIDTGTHAFNTGTQRIRVGTELDDTPKIAMDVAEILIYDRALTAYEMGLVQDYLDTQYFPPPVPTIDITTPAENDTIPGDSISVSWTAGGDTTVANHVHVKLDDLPRVSIPMFTGTHVFNGVAIGQHVVQVELATESHVVLATDSVHVFVSGQPPVAAPDTAFVEQGDSVVVDVLANDSDGDGTVDSTTVTIVTPPARGAIDTVDAVSGTIRYIHDGTFTAVDSFTYTVRDDLGNASNEAVVHIDVNLTGDPPAVENVVLTATSPGNSTDDSLMVGYDLLPPADVASTAWYRNDVPMAALMLPMEGSDVTALLDFSGVGNSVSKTGAPAWSGGSGHDGGGALTFVTGDALVVSDASVFDVDHVTVAAWIRIDSYVDDMRIVSKEFGTAEPYSIYTLNMGTPGVYTQGENKLEFRVGLEGQNRIRVTGNAIIPLDTWTHVAATFDGSNVTLYINGAVDKVQAATGVLRKNNEPVYVAASQFYGQYFDGTIDDVRVYGYALSPEQMNALAMLGGDVIVPQETAGDEAWRACVTPYGLGIDGAAVCSNTITIGIVAPVALDDTAMVATADSVLIDVLANDSDSDGTVDSTSVTIVTPPQNGTAEVDSVLGTIKYTHDGSATDADSLTYTVLDDDSTASNVATVRITITPIPNTPPLALDDTTMVTMADSVVIDVLANDSDSDGTIDSTSVTIMTPPQNGTAEVDSVLGTIKYTHDGSATDADSLTYTVLDDDSTASNVATVRIAISLIPNAPPLALDDTTAVTMADSVIIDVLANDTDSDGTIDSTSVTIMTPPLNGTAEVDSVLGTIKYTHDGSATDADSLTYTVLDDDSTASNVATVRIAITPIPNAPPVAVDDSTLVLKGDSVIVDVLANDSDSDGTIDSTSVVIITPPVNGTAEVDSVTGAITYVHDGTMTDADSLTYTVLDDDSTVSNVATVRITVDIISATGGGQWAPSRYALLQNVPNPFNPTTTITFDVPVDGDRVTLEVYDVRGRLVARLVDGPQSAGRKQVKWNGVDRRGQHAASGVYFYRLRAPGFQQTRKMVLLQ